MVDFGNTLKILRTKENMTQAQLARKLNLTKSVISAYLLGQESRHQIDLSGLTTDEIAALLKLIKTMKKSVFTEIERF